MSRSVRLTTLEVTSGVKFSMGDIITVMHAPHALCMHHVSIYFEWTLAERKTNALSGSTAK